MQQKIFGDKYEKKEKISERFRGFLKLFKTVNVVRNLINGRIYNFDAKTTSSRKTCVVLFAKIKN